jgi:hypothetical protein
MNPRTPTPEELRALAHQLRRKRLAHALMTIRTKNNPDKRHYHEVVAEDCRARIEYIEGMKP